VDIISMSWTIEATRTDSKDLALFEEAINEAKKKDILMFCATSDQGSISSENCYPGKWGNCIKIGAATAFGDKCTWVADGHYDYLLPGKNIPFKWKRPDGFSTWYESGSSLSTALASGLSGLLLYCDRVVNGKESRNFRTEAMSDLFRNLAVTSKDHKFLRADVWFSKKFQGYFQESSSASQVLANMQARNGQTEIMPLSGAKSSSLKPLSQIPWSEESSQALGRLLAEMKASF
jgi:Subtilase family